MRTCISHPGGDPIEPVTYDVVVVGAGPTGLVTALLLGNQGHRVAVVERWPAPYPLPRAVGISHEALRALHAAGVLEEVVPTLYVTPDGSRVSEIRTAEGEVLARRSDAGESLSGWPERASFYQPDLEAILDRAAAAHPRVSLLRGWEVTEVRADGDGVEVRAVGQAAREQELNLAGRYVVGCDGANSVVRSGRLAEQDDLEFAFDWLVVDVVPRGERIFTPHLGQILGPPRPTTMVSGGPGRRRWEFMRLPGERREDLDSAEAAWRLLEPYDVGPDNADLERHAVYTFGGRWSRHWRHGRVVLAGDAAHLMPPFLGEGFNSGIRDARAIAWCLDLVLRGLASDSLLDLYSAERLGHVRQIVKQAVALGRVFCVLDPAAAEQRDHRLREVRDRVPGAADDVVARPAWRLGPGLWRSEDPQAGYLGLQATLGHDGEQALACDLLPAGRFQLIGLDADPTLEVAEEVRLAWAELDGVVLHVGDGAAYQDVDGRYRRWFEELGSRVVLLRPDGYVFGATADPAGSGTLLADLVQQLQGIGSAAVQRTGAE